MVSCLGKQNRGVAIDFQNPDGILPYYLTVNGLSEPAHRQKHIPATRVPSRSGNHEDQQHLYSRRQAGKACVEFQMGNIDEQSFSEIWEGDVIETLGNHW